MHGQYQLGNSEALLSIFTVVNLTLDIIHDANTLDYITCIPSRKNANLYRDCSLSARSDQRAGTLVRACRLESGLRPVAGAVELTYKTA